LIFLLAHVPIYLDGPEKVVAHLMETGGAMFSNQMFRLSPKFQVLYSTKIFARFLSVLGQLSNEVSDDRLRLLQRACQPLGGPIKVTLH